MGKEDIEKQLEELTDMVDTLTIALKELQAYVEDLDKDFRMACSDTYSFITEDY